MKILPASLADAEAIARVHVASWQSTYRGLLPEGFLNNLSVDRSTKTWQRVLGPGAARNFAFVAEIEEGGIVGFVDSGPEREGNLGYDCELYAIYVLEDFQGQGWGRQLFERAKLDLKERGFKSMLLWVLKDNESARGFYESMGGVLAGEKEAEIGGVKAVEVAYGWKELITSPTLFS